MSESISDRYIYPLRKLTGEKSPQTVAGIFFQLAAALAYCHWGLGVGTVDGCDQFYVEKSWRAILHRDIKPGNGERSTFHYHTFSECYPTY